MNILDKVKRLLGIKSVNIGELNRRAKPKPEEHRSVPPDPLKGIQIGDEYRKIVSSLEACAPVVFVTGGAGTGKSTLIHYLRTVLKKKMAVVAPTGVAALNSGGSTIHSFFSFPHRIHEEKDIKLVYDRRLYQALELLIIDEVSMVRSDLMDSIDKFLRLNRSRDAPFGGVQLLLIGDLFQLPPIVKSDERIVLERKGYQSPYFFSSFSLQNSSLVPVELTTIYRQEDAFFVGLLNSVRKGEDLESVINEINTRCCRSEGSRGGITLTCINARADRINMIELRRLSGQESVFIGQVKGKFLEEKDTLPTPYNLVLKTGARVMFTKNDEDRRWVNGTLGDVRRIDQDSISVKLDRLGSIYDVQQVTWEKYKYVYDAGKDKIVAQKIGEYTQFPLMLAWAVTIHKSQGKTLETVRIDLGSGAFATGQVYVALSRCRSIEGVHLARPIRETDVKCDPVIRRFYDALEEMTKDAES